MVLFHVEADCRAIVMRSERGAASCQSGHLARMGGEDGVGGPEFPPVGDLGEGVEAIGINDGRRNRGVREQEIFDHFSCLGSLSESASDKQGAVSVEGVEDELGGVIGDYPGAGFGKGQEGGLYSLGSDGGTRLSGIAMVASPAPTRVAAAAAR